MSDVLAVADNRHVLGHARLSDMLAIANSIQLLNMDKALEGLACRGSRQTLDGLASAASRYLVDMPEVVSSTHLRADAVSEDAAHPWLGRIHQYWLQGDGNVAILDGLRKMGRLSRWQTPDVGGLRSVARGYTFRREQVDQT